MTTPATTRPADAALRLESAALWQFSLSLYPQVKTLCLRWQDSYQANVNVLLALCYAERLGWQLTPDALAQASLPLSALNSQITQALRQCRRQLPALPLANQQQLLLKQSLLNTELLAEQLEQQLLCTHLHFTANTAANNLALYLQYLQLPTTSALAADIIDLRQACTRIPLSSE